MTAIAAMSINNGLTIPVACNFEVAGVQNGRIDYAFKDDTGAHTIAARHTISISNRPLKNGSGNYKATILVRVPRVYEAITEDASTHDILGVSTAKLEFVIPADSVQADIDDLLAYIKNVLSEAQVTSTVQDGVLPY